MGQMEQSRKRFLASAGAAVVLDRTGFAFALRVGQQPEAKADYTLTIATQPIELAPKRIVSVTTYTASFQDRFSASRKGCA
jgi:hypothetical protein